MLILFQKRIVHREIAVRNVLLGKNNAVKISDFGMARRLPEKQDYWAPSVSSDLPIRYMPPEAFETKHFSQATDVWSFGVAMWETMAFVGPTLLIVPHLYRFGRMPYKTENIELDKIGAYVKGGGRLKIPDVCLSIDSHPLTSDRPIASMSLPVPWMAGTNGFSSSPPASTRSPPFVRRFLRWSHSSMLC
jgi:serine/threonine protein kinase